jgi:nucleotide-binding universal stress UspA family protein
MSKTARPVLVGVGEYGVSDAVLVHAIGIARGAGVGVRLVHVVPKRRGMAAQPGLLIDDDAFELVAEELVHRAADSARQLGGENLSVEVFTEQGSAVQVLRSLAADASCVVLQRRRLSQLHRVFTGSVTTALAGQAGVPVVSVPEFWAPWPTTPSLVTVGVQGTDLHRELLERAFAAAAAEQACLRVLFACYLPALYYDGHADPGITEKWASSMRPGVEHEVEAVAKGYPEVAVLVDVVAQRPVDALVEATRTSHLLIIGRPGLSHRIPRLGSVSRAVLREALCPVELLPLPPREEASPSDEGEA